MTYYYNHYLFLFSGNLEPSVDVVFERILKLLKLHSREHIKLELELYNGN